MSVIPDRADGDRPASASAAPAAARPIEDVPRASRRPAPPPPRRATPCAAACSPSPTPWPSLLATLVAELGALRVADGVLDGRAAPGLAAAGQAPRPLRPRPPRAAPPHRRRARLDPHLEHREHGGRRCRCSRSRPPGRPDPAARCASGSARHVLAAAPARRPPASLWRGWTPPATALLVGSGPLEQATRRKLELFGDIHVDVAGQIDSHDARGLADETSRSSSASRGVRRRRSPTA